MKTFRATPNASIPALVLRDGVEVAVELKTDSEGRVGVYLEPAFDLPRLARAVDRVSIATADSDLAPTPSTDSFDTPAKALEIVPLGMIVSMNGQPIADFRALRDALFSLANATPAETAIDVRFELRDPSPEASTTVATTTLTSDDLARIRTLEFSFPIPETLFDPEFTVLSAGGDPLRAITMGFRQTVVMIEQVFLTIDRVSRGSVGVDQLQGPVGILHTGTQVASEGPMFMVFFLAMISVNLAVVNLLPIPIADGGLFLFLVYEKLRGRPPSIAFQNAAAMAGIALVAGLFLLTFYNDIGRLFS
jgi:regulator of sigma E protease